MERYFTTVALLGVNDGNLPVHRLVKILPKLISIQRYEIKEIRFNRKDARSFRRMQKNWT